jgi:hypothetical protein
VDDQLTIIFVAVTFLILILAFIGRRKNATTRSKWRTATAASLWAVNAMLFGGVSTPVEKGKVTKVRKRETDEEDDAIGE